MLTIEIGPAGLKTIYAAGRMVTLARRVDCLFGIANRVPEMVAWQTFQPLEINVVEVDPAIYCFATTTTIRAGASLVMNSRCAIAARPGTNCVLEDGHFSVQALDPVSEALAASNAMRSPVIGLGVAQAATINGETKLCPACVCAVMRNETVFFQPTATVAVFLSACTGGGTVIGPVGAALSVKIDAETKIGFDADTNQFVELSQSI